MPDHQLKGSDPNEIGGLVIKKKTIKKESDEGFQKPSMLGLERKYGKSGSQVSGKIPQFKNRFQNRSSGGRTPGGSRTPGDSRTPGGNSTPSGGGTPSGSGTA